MKEKKQERFDSHVVGTTALIDRDPAGQRVAVKIGGSYGSPGSALYLHMSQARLVRERKNCIIGLKVDFCIGTYLILPRAWNDRRDPSPSL